MNDNNKLNMIGKMRVSMHHGLKNKQVVFMTAIGVKIKASPSTNPEDLELWTDPIILSAEACDRILDIVKMESEISGE